MHDSHSSNSFVQNTRIVALTIHTCLKIVLQLLFRPQSHHRCLTMCEVITFIISASYSLHPPPFNKRCMCSRSLKQDAPYTHQHYICFFPRTNRCISCTCLVLVASIRSIILMRSSSIPRSTRSIFSNNHVSGLELASGEVENSAVIKQTREFVSRKTLHLPITHRTPNQTKSNIFILQYGLVRVSY